ncbi:MAG: NAD-dependent epimerase/dehydratase family protein, partial [Acidobacteriota bacterium]
MHIDRHRDHRLLLTGASGFLGTPTLEQLVERGWTVHAVSRQPKQHGGVTRPDNVTWHSADLLDSGDVAAVCREVRPTHLLHLAWTSGREGFRDGMENYRWVGATMELLR